MKNTQKLLLTVAVAAAFSLAHTLLPVKRQFDRIALASYLQ